MLLRRPLRPGVISTVTAAAHTILHHIVHQSELLSATEVVSKHPDNMTSLATLPDDMSPLDTGALRRLRDQTWEHLLATLTDETSQAHKDASRAFTRVDQEECRRMVLEVS